MNLKKCAACQDPTKYTVGFWDGIDPKTGERIHGQFYNCKNELCEAKKKFDVAADLSRLEHKIIEQSNLNNGIDLTYMKALRIHADFSQEKAAAIIGIDLMDYNNYENGHAAMPIEYYARLIGAFSNEQ